MYKRHTFCRVAALALAVLLFALPNCACKKDVNDNSEYLSKGEFMNLFVSEINLSPSDDKTQISIEKDSIFYTAALALVQIGYLTDEEVAKEIEKPVTKEFVAVLCVRNLFFRQQFDNIVLKDERELDDPQVCKDAVGHEIVTIENGYFDADRKMTKSECISAIDRMLYIDAYSEFQKDEAEVEVLLNENVENITGEIEEEDFVIVDPTDEKFSSIVDGMVATRNKNDFYQNGQQHSTSVGDVPIREGIVDQSCRRNNSTSFNYLTNGSAEQNTYRSLDDAEEGDCVVVRLPKTGSVRRFDVGEMILFGTLLRDEYNYNSLHEYKNAMVGEVIAVNSQDPTYIFYTLRIPSDEEVIDSAKLERYSSKANNLQWQVEEIDPDLDGLNGLSVGPLQFTDSGIKVTVSQTISNPVDSWRDAKFDVDMKYTFELKDIGVQISGFGSVLKGKIDNAICRLDYTVVNTFDVSTSLRVTPDDNRNGKFLNNLSRSRFTGANAAGAEEIKIARLHANIGCGFNIEMYVYLTIQIDGSIRISVETGYGRGFRIVNNKVMPIYESTVKKNAKLNVNLEAAVHCDFSLRWIRRKGSPWADLDLQAGFGLDCVSKVFILNESHDACEAITVGYISNDVLSSVDPTEIDYCFDVRLYWFYEVSGLNKDTKIGKIIRWFDSDFELTTGKVSNDIKNWHYENGHAVAACTKEYSEAVSADSSFGTEDTSQTGVVTGAIVCSQSQVPPNLGGVLVSVYSESEDGAMNFITSTTTDSLGKYSVELEAGRYYVEVGYTTLDDGTSYGPIPFVGKFVDVRGGQTTSVEDTHMVRVPDGYHPNDYLRLRTFLDIEDENGVKNGEKACEWSWELTVYDPDNPETWGDLIWWKEVDGIKRIIRIGFPDDTIGVLDIRGCDKVDKIWIKSMVTKIIADDDLEPSFFVSRDALLTEINWNYKKEGISIHLQSDGNGYVNIYWEDSDEYVYDEYYGWDHIKDWIISATPKNGYTFLGWYDSSGNCVSTDEEYVITNIYQGKPYAWGEDFLVPPLGVQLELTARFSAISSNVMD